MNRRTGYVFVWPIGTRIIHWMMALSFTLAFITSFYQELLHHHIAFGFIFFIVIIYRIIWGFVGPRYATFRTFKLSLVELKEYFVEKIKNRWREIPAGHNPASSWFTIWAMGVGSIIIISGLLLYGVQEAKGIFAYLNSNYSQHMELLDNLHKYSAYLFLFWVILHISGVLIEQFWHKTDMVFAMISGCKKTVGEDTEVKLSLSIFAFSTILIATVTYFFIIGTHDNFMTQQKFKNIDYEKIDPTYTKECGECHTAYPPFLLPEESWRRVMSGLDNHFGEEITEANITKSQQKSILSFLTKNSAESSTREVSVAIMKSLGDRRPKAITKTPYWRERHKGIPKSAFEDKKIKDKSNCKACHIDFEYGNLDDMNIRY